MVVTGAGSGLGLATARLLVGRGASMGGMARTDHGLDAIAGVGAEPIRGDVTIAANRASLKLAGGFVTW